MAKKPSIERDSLPCEHAQVVLGMAWQPLPRNWQTKRMDCHGCGAGFTIAAREQKFWYEELKIPFHVEINRCPTCRRTDRAARRIMAVLSRLLPIIERKAATADQMRTAAVVIVEGMQTQIRCRWIGIRPLLSTPQIAEKGVWLISQLMKDDKKHVDLLPLLQFLHGHLGHAKQVEIVDQQLEMVRQAGGASFRHMRVVEDWLRMPTKSRRELICHI